jgi:hypothetical protein
MTYLSEIELDGIGHIDRRLKSGFYCLWVSSFSFQRLCIYIPDT